MRKITFLSTSLSKDKHTLIKINLDNVEIYLERNDNKICVLLLKTINVNLLDSYQHALRLNYYQQNQEMHVGLMGRDRFVFYTFVGCTKLDTSLLLEKIIHVINLSGQLQ